MRRTGLWWFLFLQHLMLFLVCDVEFLAVLSLISCPFMPVCCRVASVTPSNLIMCRLTTVTLTVVTTQTQTLSFSLVMFTWMYLVFMSSTVCLLSPWKHRFNLHGLFVLCSVSTFVQTYLSGTLQWWLLCHLLPLPPSFSPQSQSKLHAVFQMTQGNLDGNKRAIVDLVSFLLFSCRWTLMPTTQWLQWSLSNETRDCSSQCECPLSHRTVTTTITLASVNTMLILLCIQKVFTPQWFLLHCHLYKQ